jgi:hypothetical protein
MAEASSHPRIPAPPHTNSTHHRLDHNSAASSTETTAALPPQGLHAQINNALDCPLLALNKLDNERRLNC